MFGKQFNVVSLQSKHLYSALKIGTFFIKLAITDLFK